MSSNSSNSGSSDIAISVRGLSKKYSIARQGVRHTTAAEALMSRLKNPAQKVERDDFWALRDVSFDVKKGDVVGIVGRNGAGKSTLLKVLSRITEPTSGEAILHGRVGSLLEVGTGFHPELTGRENIYLNGAILGMTRGEITRQFDAIVDFSGTEKFLDTPVKRYSSGMYVRLAFAVAAHLSPEILIVDEVLAVGDADFQKKCLGKMQDVASGGRTVLFVSHNEAAVRRLCSKCVLMRSGQVQLTGTPEEAFAAYRGERESPKFTNASRTVSGGPVQIEDAFLSVDGMPTSEIFNDSNLTMTLKISAGPSAPDNSFCPEMLFKDQNGLPVLFSSTGLFQGQRFTLNSNATESFTLALQLPYLAAGKYIIDLMLADPGKQFFDYIEDALVVEVVPTTNALSGHVYLQSRGQGYVAFEAVAQS